VAKNIFFCIDAHTCGNPVRLVAGGGPALIGKNMSEKRQHFIKEFDWVRRALMFEPRGHDMMSGSILYPPIEPNHDAAVLFIETSGCLPMCGHGTIGTVTIAIEEGLIKPKKFGSLHLETPAGIIDIEYTQDQGKVKSVKLTNVPAFLYKQNLQVDCPGLGPLVVDISYGGNFYAIVDLQDHFLGIDEYSTGELIAWSRFLRKSINSGHEIVHPLDPTIRGCSHVLWSGKIMDSASTARNAVVYGEKAIDRSPCGTGTSARMAQWVAMGKLKKGDLFVHESIIGSRFSGRVEELTQVGPFAAIIPSVEGWAKLYGYNTICVDPDDDPFALGFQVL
jgi:4-hydroxyproline epimerase